jgi:hypothetical protein
MDASGCKPAGSCEPERRQDYEPPRVERVLTPAELQREILYAGPPGTFPPLTAHTVEGRAHE